MSNFNSKCKTKYSDLTKEYTNISKQFDKSETKDFKMTFKVNNNNINNFKNKVITSKNRNYNNSITID